MQNLKKYFRFILILCCSGLLLFTNAQIPFELDQGGHIILKAKINGVEGKFILDTGAGLNVLFKKFAQKTEFIKSSNFFVGHRATGEEIMAELVTVKTMELDSYSLTNQQFTVYDTELGDIDGLISLQPFMNMPLTIDYGKKQIFINRKLKTKKSINIQLADYAGKAIDIFTEVTLNDTLNIQVMLDSGAGSNSFWFSSRLLAPLNLRYDSFRNMPRKSDFKKGIQNYFYLGPIKKLATENKMVVLEKPSVAFVDGLIYEGKTSLDWLGKVITIDVSKKKIFIGE